MEPKQCLVLRGLSKYTKAVKVFEALGKYGSVVTYTRPLMPDGSLSGECYVKYENDDMTAQLLEKGELLINDVVVTVHLLSANKPDKQSKHSTCILQTTEDPATIFKPTEDPAPVYNPTDVALLNSVTPSSKKRKASTDNEDSLLSNPNLRKATKLPRLETDNLNPTSPSPQIQSGTKIFIKNLPENFQRHSIIEVFKKFGKINMVWTKPGTTFGFIIFNEEKSARTAVSHGPHIVDSKEIIVELPESTKVAESSTIFVGGLNKCVDDVKLCDALGQFGTVVKRQRRDQSTFMFVTFSSEEAANKAISAGFMTVNGRRLFLKPTTRH